MFFCLLLSEKSFVDTWRLSECRDLPVPGRDEPHRFVRMLLQLLFKI